MAPIGLHDNAQAIDLYTASWQREVRLIRHADKNPSTAAVDPNQLTEKGRRDALAYGVALQKNLTLEVYCSTDAEGKPIDRAHDTGWYIHAGYAGLDYTAANALFRSDSVEKKQFVPGLEELLQQRVPERISNQYKAKEITRAEAMERCYQMLGANNDGVDPFERALMLEGAQCYLAAILYHLLDKAQESDDRIHELEMLARIFNLPLKRDSVVHPYSDQAIVFVGHDPNIGGLLKYIDPDAHFSELAPLTGIRVTRILPLLIQYSFGSSYGERFGRLAADTSYRCDVFSQRTEVARKLL